MAVSESPKFAKIKVEDAAELVFGEELWGKILHQFTFSIRERCRNNDATKFREGLFGDDEACNIVGKEMCKIEGCWTCS